MSKLTAEIPLSKIERIQIYINAAKKTLAAIKKKPARTTSLTAGVLVDGEIYHVRGRPILLGKETVKLYYCDI